MTSYFGTKIRTCPVEDRDIEMLLLKMLLREALLQGLALSYENRIYVIPAKDRLSIVRMTEPDRAVDIPVRRPADAVDRFIESFIFESDADINKVIIYHSSDSSDAGTTWGFAKVALKGLWTLLGHNSLPDILTVAPLNAQSDPTA